MDTQISGPSRFFFCRTPLQALIIQQIRALSPGRDTIVYNPTSESIKHRRYFESMTGESNCFIKYRYPLNSQIMSDLRELLLIPHEIRVKNYDEMYISSIGALSFAVIAGRNRKAALRTFDDGTFNLRRDDFEDWINDGGPIHHRILRAALSAVHSREIVARADQHYTIFDQPHMLYPDKRNLKIDLFPDIKRMKVAALGELVVVLGTPIHLVNPMKSSQYYDFIRFLRPDIYIPHPAEIQPVVQTTEFEMDAELAKYLRERIAEEIVWLLRRRGYSVQIHGFGSTALLNLAGVGKLFNHLIHSEDRELAALFSRFDIDTDYPF